MLCMGSVAQAETARLLTVNYKGKTYKLPYSESVNLNLDDSDSFIYGVRIVKTGNGVIKHNFYMYSSSGTVVYRDVNPDSMHYTRFNAKKVFGIAPNRYSDGDKYTGNAASIYFGGPGNYSDGGQQIGDPLSLASGHPFGFAKDGNQSFRLRVYFTLNAKKVVDGKIAPLEVGDTGEVFDDADYKDLEDGSHDLYRAKGIDGHQSSYLGEGADFSFGSIAKDLLAIFVPTDSKALTKMFNDVKSKVIIDDETVLGPFSGDIDISFPMFHGQMTNILGNTGGNLYPTVTAAVSWFYYLVTAMYLWRKKEGLFK